MKNDTLESLNLDFPSQEELAPAIMEQVRCWLELVFSGEKVDGVIVLRELIENAIRHGNHGDAERRVRVTAEKLDRERCRMTVQDDGQGFDLQKVNLELPLEDPRFLRARGLILVHALSESMFLLPPGNRIQVIIRLSTAGIEDQPEEGKRTEE